MNDPDFIPWLLAARIPSIRYLTLRRLLGRPEEDADVRAARREMAASGPGLGMKNSFQVLSLTVMQAFYFGAA